MNTIIETTNLVKTYTIGTSTIKALDHISLTISKGEMIAIVGPSGSGKSTLMHILGCLDRPDEGVYKLNDQDVHNLSTDQLAEIRGRQIGFVFQTFNLLPRISAIENVELPLQYSGLRNTKKKAEAALDIVGLSDRMHHDPSQLSGGERQRVAIARAVVSDPAIILADEPTGNLDSRTSDEILGLFTELNTQDRTIIMVTHNETIADFCKRKVRFADGRIQEA
jgi:putative ABC transport system ATP-binding protein